MLHPFQVQWAAALPRPVSLAAVTRLLLIPRHKLTLFLASLAQALPPIPSVAIKPMMAIIVESRNQMIEVDRHKEKIEKQVPSTRLKVFFFLVFGHLL